MPIKGSKHQQEGAEAADEQELALLIDDYLDALQRQGRSAPLPLERLNQLHGEQRDRALFSLRMLRASWGAGLVVSPSPVEAHQHQSTMSPAPTGAASTRTCPSFVLERAVLERAVLTGAVEGVAVILRLAGELSRALAARHDLLEKVLFRPIQRR
jgi:hypothetical protein